MPASCLDLGKTPTCREIQFGEAFLIGGFTKKESDEAIRRPMVALIFWVLRLQVGYGSRWTSTFGSRQSYDPIGVAYRVQTGSKNTWQLLPAKDAGLAGVIRLLHRVESYWFAIRGRHAP